MKTAIYARYSSDQQSATSLADQVRLCRRHAEQQGWQVVEVYEDAALSGASVQRPAYQRLLADAASGHFEAVLAESLDRLSRRLADTAQLYDELRFHRVKLVTLQQGEITELHVGMLGTVAQIYLSDLRDKTRRGLLGRIAQGRSAGGLAYGYRALAGETGAREIVESEAAVVRRVFKEFATGRSPRAIAKALNAEGIPGPGGRAWSETTIRGQAARGTGLLNNDLYRGRLIWNRCAYVKDPRSGRRQARPNPPERWEEMAVPELRIVADDLWQAVKDRQQEACFAIGRDAAGNALNRAHRRRFLLSRLLICGSCGSGYTIMAKDRYGCAAHRSKGTCGNDRTIRRQEIEARVLDGLQERLLTPELVAEFAAEYAREATRLAAEQESSRGEAARRLASLSAQIERLVDAVAAGHASPALLARLESLEVERTRLAQQPVTAVQPIRLHPSLPALYRRKVAELTAALNAPEIREEAGELLRSLIEKVVLTPEEDGGLAVLLHGDLARILSLCEGGGRKGKLPGTAVPGSQVSVVAGAGFEPATFRL